MTLKTILPFIILSLFMILGALASNINLNQGLSTIFINTNAVVLNNTETWNVESLSTGDVNMAQIYTYLNDTMTAAEINDAIDNTNMIVMFLKGDYYIEDVIWLKSNKTYIINPGVTIAWLNGSVPFNHKVHDGGTPNWIGNGTQMLRAQNEENIVFLNYGFLYPSRVERAFFNKSTAYASLINTSNAYVHGGYSKTDIGFAVMGGFLGATSWSENVIVKNIITVPPIEGSEELTESGQGLVAECVDQLIAENIIGRGSEGVDFNNHVVNAIISELIFANRLNDQTELVDIDASPQVMANNIIGINYDNIATFQTTAGYRYADCTLDDLKRNMHAFGTCNGCKNAAELSTNSSLIVFDGNEYYMSNASIDMKGQNITNVLNFTLTNGTIWK